MSRPLPVRVNPFRLAELEQSLEGSVKLSGMKRLARVLAGAAEDAQCELSFSKPRAREFRLHIHVKAKIPLECQRCLKVYLEDIDSDVELALLHTEAQEALVSDGLEPHLVSDDTLDLAALVEDELLLSVPTIPRHPHDEECSAQTLHEFDSDEILEEETESEEKPNPFAVLGDLKEH